MLASAESNVSVCTARVGRQATSRYFTKASAEWAAKFGVTSTFDFGARSVGVLKTANGPYLDTFSHLNNAISM